MKKNQKEHYINRNWKKVDPKKEYNTCENIDLNTSSSDKKSQIIHVGDTKEYYDEQCCGCVIF